MEHIGRHEGRSVRDSVVWGGGRILPSEREERKQPP